MAWHMTYKMQSMKYAIRDIKTKNGHVLKHIINTKYEYAWNVYVCNYIS